jgi:hypothetical protein
MITLFPSRCYNGGKQHRFEARWTQEVTPGTIPREFHGPGMIAVALVEAGTVTNQIYQGAVCRWCGAVVNKPKESQP